MTQPGARFSGAIVGAMPEVLVTSSTTATNLTSTIWTLALAVGEQTWKETWSPTRDERRKKVTDPRHKAAWQARRSALNRAKDKFEKVLAQRFAEALHGADATVAQLALALERVRAGDYTSPAGSARVDMPGLLRRFARRARLDCALHVMLPCAQARASTPPSQTPPRTSASSASARC